MSDNKLVVYFFSGTGNSHRVAAWMGETARGRGFESLVRSVDVAEPSRELREGAMLGLVFPTHGFTAPWHILRFAWGLPRGRGEAAFCVATRAGLKLGRLFTPGISGSALFLVALLLLLKRRRVRGATAIDMPSNWTAVHPGLNPRAAGAIIERARPRAVAFMQRLIGGQRAWPVRTLLYEAVLGTALLPVSLGYMLVGRFMLAKIWFASSACTRCGLCGRSCPVGAISFPGGGRPFWRYSCEGCMRCMSFCPEQAVQSSHAWLALLVWLLSPGLVAWPAAKAAALAETWWPVAGGLFERAVWWSTVFSTIVLAYYGLFYLSRRRAGNRLLMLTTFTGLYRRYSEHGTTLEDITGRAKREPSDAKFSNPPG